MASRVTELVAAASEGIARAGAHWRVPHRYTYADFRRLGVYADAIARMERQDVSDWTPFLSIGAGLIQDRVAFDDQVFTDLSPVGRFRAGAEKKINDKATFGIGVGPSFKLD